MKSFIMKLFAKDMLTVYQLLEAQHKMNQMLINRQEDLEKRIRLLESKKYIGWVEK